MAFEFTCPNCSTTLRTAEPVPAGRRAKCPQCAAVFEVGNPPPPPAEPVARKAPARRRPARAKRKKSSAGPLALSIGAAVLLAAAGVTAFILLAGDAGLKAKLRHAPPETAVVAVADIERLKNHPDFGPGFTRAVGQLAAARGVGQLTYPARAYVFAARGNTVSAVLEYADGAGGEGRIKELFPAAKKAASPGGLSHFESGGAKVSAPGEDNLLITSAAGADLDAVLGGRGGPDRLSAELPEVIDRVAARDVWAAIDLRRLGVASPPEAPTLPRLNAALKAAWPGMKGMAVWADLKGNSVTVGVGLLCSDEDLAAEVAEQARRAVPHAKEGLIVSIPPALAGLLDGARFQADGPMAVMTLDLTGDRLADLNAVNPFAPPAAGG